jgi:hypothetical protein
LIFPQKNAFADVQFARGAGATDVQFSREAVAADGLFDAIAAAAAVDVFVASLSPVYGL